MSDRQQALDAIEELRLSLWLSKDLIKEAEGSLYTAERNVQASTEGMWVPLVSHVAQVAAEARRVLKSTRSTATKVVRAHLQPQENGHQQ